MPKQSTRYQKNLELFARDNPLEAFRLDDIDCSSIKTCRTDENELNLIDESGARQSYLHAQYGAVLDAEIWAQKLVLKEYDVIFVYGLGLGYYYIPLKKWLEENPSRHLVFLEDNPCVIRHFLHTALATEILGNSQVIVRLIPKIEPNEEGWATLRLSESSLLWAFAFSRPYVTALQSYFFSRLDFFSAFSLQWLSELARTQQGLSEFYPSIPIVFHNFYANMLYLGESIPGYRLANAMRSVPVVLCGAGPSLTKQLPILNELSGQIFLMAAGSAMNAVTQAGVIPHVGGAVDHTPAQASRQLTSFAFEVPAFYQNRFYDKAFTQWHGPLLFMTGSGGYRVSEWFEKELEIENAEQIVMGVSTTNFLLEIAGFLGCSPIVLVGVDLAYTEDSRYAAGVSAHPTDQKERHAELNSKRDNLLAVPGMDGKDVYTNTVWFYEAVCIAGFKQRNPEIICLNATEGGMAIPGVPNVTLSRTAEKYFMGSTDAQGWFHGAIQNASSHRIPSDKVFQTLEKWKASLEACANYLGLLIKKASSSKGKAQLWLHELHQEVSYEYLLEDLEKIFDTLNMLRIRRIKRIPKIRERTKEQLALDVDRYAFLMGYAQDHLKSIYGGLQAFKERQAALSEIHLPQEKLKGQILPPEYRADGGRLSIHEPSLGLAFNAEYHPSLIPETSWPKSGDGIEALIGKVGEQQEGQSLYFYPDGKLKVEAFYKKGQLHGPWTFYSAEGKILYRSWHVDGKKTGKCAAYYLNGSLYSLLGYRGGELQGAQFYYYADGILKTFEEYENGKLSGVVRLYYSNGQMKKEQHFSGGKLHGAERLWDERGKLMIEASYEYGKVIDSRRHTR